MRNMETALGHRLQVRSAIRQPKRRGIYHVEAWSYLDVDEPDTATAFVLRLVQKLARSIRQPYCFNSNPTFQDSDIVAYYWDNDDHINIPKFGSSGVLLQHYGDHYLTPSVEKDYEEPRSTERLEYLKLVAAAPRLRVPRLRGTRDFVITYDVRIWTSTKEKLVRLHLPHFLTRNFPGGVDVVDIATRSRDQGPFRITLRHVLRQMTDDQAIAACMALCGRKRLELDVGEFGSIAKLTAHPYDSDGTPDGIAGYELEPAPTKCG